MGILRINPWGCFSLRLFLTNIILFLLNNNAYVCNRRSACFLLQVIRSAPVIVCFASKSSLHKFLSHWYSFIVNFRVKYDFMFCCYWYCMLVVIFYNFAFLVVHLLRLENILRFTWFPCLFI